MTDRELEPSMLVQIFERFARVEERLARLEERMDALTHRVDDLGGEMRSLRLRVDTMLLAMLGLIATLAIKL